MSAGLTGERGRIARLMSGSRPALLSGAAGAGQMEDRV
jgi:hypothetical protein